MVKEEGMKEAVEAMKVSPEKREGIEEEKIKEGALREGELPEEIEKRGSLLKEEERTIKDEVMAMVEKEGRLLPVYFDYDKYSLREDAIETIRKNARWLKENPSSTIMIEGHADERGSNEYNLALGDRRAKSVMDYLKDLGIKNTLLMISYGEERPVCKESNKECWAKNRRAELILLSE